MAEEKFVKLTIDVRESIIEALKARLKASGNNSANGPLSATQAVLRAVDLYQAHAQAVRLDPPERAEIESRTAAQTPIRNSKDILRAFERVAGGPDAVAIDLDPSVAELIRSTGRGLGWGLGEFAKIILEDAFATNYVQTIELRQIFFTPQEYSALLSALGRNRITGGSDLLAAVRELKNAAEPVGAKSS